MYDELDSDDDALTASNTDLVPTSSLVDELKSYNDRINFNTFQTTSLSGGANTHPIARELYEVFLNPQCNAKQPLLTDYQEIALQKIFELNFDKQRGLYYVMAAGFGKSYIMGALCSLYMSIGYGVICLSVARLDSTLRNTFQKFSGFQKQHLCMLHHRTNNWQIKLSMWYQQRKYPAKTVFLVDEVHLFASLDRYRNIKGIPQVQRSKILLDFITNSGDAHIYFFSATPIVTSFVDLRLVNLLIARYDLERREELPLPLTEEDFEKRFGKAPTINLAGLAETLRPYLIYVHKQNILPQMEEPLFLDIEFGLSEQMEYLHGYSVYGEIDPLNCFQAQTINEVGAHKINALIDILERYPLPIIVYVERIAKLATTVSKPFTEAGIPYAILSAHESPTVWYNVMELFNSSENREGKKLSIVFYGPGAQVGISFITARTVILMMPKPSYFQIIQIISRALRKNSLEYLSKEERAVRTIIFVSVFNPDHILMFPSGTGTKIQTIDQKIKNELLNISRPLYERFHLILSQLNLLKGGAEETEIAQILELLSFM